MPLPKTLRNDAVLVEESNGPTQIKTLASSILEIASESYVLVFYGGKQKMEHQAARQNNTACCVYTDDSTSQSLIEVFEAMYSILVHDSYIENNSDSNNRNSNGNGSSHNGSNHSPSIQASRVRGIYFVDYTFEELPSVVGQVFPQITQCNFSKCNQLNSFRSTLLQFPSLTTLAARDCPALTSLSSLSSIPRNMTLQAIRLNNCGLIVTRDDDWEGGMIALGNTRSTGLVLNITSCRHLKRLPSSIRFLGNVLSCLRLENNLFLHFVPAALGDLALLAEFQLIDCPLIYALPVTMWRLRGDCKVSITGNDGLIQKIRRDTRSYQPKGVVDGTVISSAYFSQKVGKMKDYFQKARMRQFKAAVEVSILLRRARFRAIHRIYRPGGAGFYRSRDSFRIMMVGASELSDGESNDNDNFGQAPLALWEDDELCMTNDNR